MDIKYTSYVTYLSRPVFDLIIRCDLVRKQMNNFIFCSIIEDGLLMKNVPERCRIEL